MSGIWFLLSRIPSLTMDANSKDILVINEEINDLDIRVTVHHSDTISVVIGCSCSPVAVDISGVIRLSNALTLIHDRLQRMVNDNCDANSGLLVIPNYRDMDCHYVAFWWRFFNRIYQREVLC